MPPKPTPFLADSCTTTAATTATTTTTTNPGTGETATNSKHVIKAGKSANPGGVVNKMGGLGVHISPNRQKHPSPSKKYNKLAEVNQHQQQEEEEEEVSDQNRLGPEVPVSGGGGGDAQEKVQPRPASSVMVKDKLELKSSIRSLKENNEALQDINKELEQKLFKVCQRCMCIYIYISLDNCCM